MSNSPAISVIMPVYNTAQYLREAIDSILNQSFTDFEFIIIDDASTDGSKEIIKSYSDKRIILIENEINKGYVFGLNYAISIAKGEYVARMDSDDISIITRLQEQILFLKENPSIKLCGSYYEVINSKKVVSMPTDHDEIIKYMLTRNSFAHPTVLINRLFLIENNLTYDEKLIPAEDYGLWINISRIGIVANIPKVLLKYRIHSNQISLVKENLQHTTANRLAWENFIHYMRLNYNIHIETIFRNETKQVLYHLMILQRLLNSGEIDFLLKNTIEFFVTEKKQEILDKTIHHNLTSLFYFVINFNTIRSLKWKNRLLIGYFTRCISLI
jgi:glycosyltransferase involved in cell wall biosynthesis